MFRIIISLSQDIHYSRTVTVRRVRHTEARYSDLSWSWDKGNDAVVFAASVVEFCHSFTDLSARSQNQCNGVLDLVFRLVGIRFITILLTISNLSASRFPARWSYTGPFTKMMGFIWINIHLGTHYVPSLADYWTINCQKKSTAQPDYCSPRYNVNDPQMYTLMVHCSHTSKVQIYLWGNHLSDKCLYPERPFFSGRAMSSLSLIQACRFLC